MSCDYSLLTKSHDCWVQTKASLLPEITLEKVIFSPYTWLNVVMREGIDRNMRSVHFYTTSNSEINQQNIISTLFMAEKQQIHHFLLKKKKSHVLNSITKTYMLLLFHTEKRKVLGWSWSTMETTEEKGIFGFAIIF